MPSNVLPLHLKQNFPSKFEFSLKVKVVGSNPGYLLKYFLLSFQIYIQALLLLSDKLPEVAVTKPHDQTPPTRRAVVNKQNDNNPFATFLTLLICVGIITGMSIFTYKVYRQKWFQKRTSNEYRVEMHRADPSATWMGRVSLVFFRRRFC